MRDRRKASDGRGGARAQRQTLSLDGEWEVGESLEADSAPSSFQHRVPVPGLTHSATPPFPEVDEFLSRENIDNQIGVGNLPASARITSAGISHQPRNYFWYRRYFIAPLHRDCAVLTVNKAQFGSKVSVNGALVGQHVGCYSAASYDIAQPLRWGTSNEVLIRIGAHPGVLPPDSPCGTDFEKTRWTPGIYDSVSVAFTDSLMIETIQVAPKISPRQVLIQATVRNTTAAARTGPVEFAVHEWKGSEVASATRTVSVAAHTSSVVTVEIPLPQAKLWSPEAPNLYAARIRLPDDEVMTRFGLRELRFDTVTRRAYLNGQVYFLRGSNITLHRFFEDPQSGRLPWNEAWVRRLLGDLPRRMHWNFIRLCIGPPPQRWLDIADEEGLMLQYEFPIWVATMRPGGKHYDTGELIQEFKGWMRDSWNHPSVALWDASNESDFPELGAAVIPAVRGLDLSGRQWENSWNPPSDPNDPVEDHPYEYTDYRDARKGYLYGDMELLEVRSGADRIPGTPPTGHAMINNEYGALWLRRDGGPAVYTEKTYATLPYPHATAAERLETGAYLLAGLTEYWRAFRYFAAVMHFVYLSCDVPGAVTGDNFRDVETLELHSNFEAWVGEAFKPLGVYINFWRLTLQAGIERDFEVMIINDHSIASRGELSLRLEDSSGAPAAQSTVPYEVEPNGQQTRRVPLALSALPGEYWLKAVAMPAGADDSSSTTSRRRLSLIAQKS